MLVRGSLFTVFFGKSFCILLKFSIGLYKLFSEVSTKWMLRLRIVHQRHQRMNNLVCCRSWLPILGTNYWKANLSIFIYVWMIDLGLEEYLRGFEGVLGREVDFNLEGSLIVRNFVRKDQPMPLENVRFIRHNVPEDLESFSFKIVQLLLQSFTGCC